MSTTWERKRDEAQAICAATIQAIDIQERESEKENQTRRLYAMAVCRLANKKAAEIRDEAIAEANEVYSKAIQPAVDIYEAAIKAINDEGDRK